MWVEVLISEKASWSFIYKFNCSAVPDYFHSNILLEDVGMKFSY